MPTLLQIEFMTGESQTRKMTLGGSRENAITLTNGKVDDMEATGMQRKRM